jgi:predicted site-specific integrase-resolvase
MINGLNVEDGEVWAEEIEVDEEELIDDLMSIIEVMFDTFIGYSECENEMMSEIMYGVLCRRLVDEIEGSL